MTERCDRLPARSSAAEESGQRQAADREAADLEEGAARQAVAVAPPGAENAEHEEKLLSGWEGEHGISVLAAAGGRQRKNG